MATNADNVQVGATGGIYVAPVGTTLPTTAAALLAAAFDELGLINEDGVTESQGSDTTDIRAWQLGAVVRRVQSSHDLTYQFSSLETNATVLEAFYGNYTSGDVQITGEQPENQCWVIEVYDGSEHHRIVLPLAQVSDRGDVSYNSQGATEYPFTLTAYPDANDVKAYIYFAQGGAS